MTGGLIEGFQKIFKGKNVVQKQIFLISLVLVGLILQLVPHDNAMLILILLPVAIILTITSNLYTLHFLHNSVKFCVYRDREDNMLSAIPLLGLIFILVSIIILFCYAFSFPIIYAKFAETYTIKGNLNF